MTNNKPVKIGRMVIYNMTGHDVLYKFENKEILFKINGCWRINEESVKNSNTELNIISTKMLVDPVPEQSYGIYYIVSKKFKQKFMHRKDFIVPALIVRDLDTNKVLYCMALNDGENNQC